MSWGAVCVWGGTVCVCVCMGCRVCGGCSVWRGVGAAVCGGGGVQSVCVCVETVNTDGPTETAVGLQKYRWVPLYSNVLNSKLRFIQTVLKITLLSLMC